LDSDGTIDLFMRHVFPVTGLPDKLISDRGPQFASKLFRGFLRKLDVESALSSAYHPQTDGQTERINQEVEQYLRLFCDHRQDDWVNWIPLAAFSYNIKRSSATGKTPFELLYGQNPRAFPGVNPSSPSMTLEERLQKQRAALDETKASLEIARRRMGDSHQDWRTTHPGFQKGDLVWLDGKNLRTDLPSTKLAPKRYGPFEVLDVLGPVTYRLKIPRTWKRIHPVFHTSLLSKYITTRENGRAYTRLAPEVVGEELEWEVDYIKDSKPSRNRRGTLFLVHYKGYPDSADEWQSWSDLANAREAIDEFYMEHPDAYRHPTSRVPGEDSA
jgi:hypothetical protein